MEIRIGIQNVSREIVIETDVSAEEVEKSVADALENAKPLLTLTDRREKKIVVPVASIGYVEIGSDTKQTVGFAAVAE
ncbi:MULTISPECIES: DUF3107 domain-containing protein [Nesterenkonia]|uniref:DUF3107 domain-containing protein n=1 Tax=Nesterenkonia xinjiangensis TaxID=225327 RepID=A0A7Z0GMU1_9MICC|nr:MULTISPECIES: DUF3107 domain-containing protein [Nesterenkonia]MDZ5076323.1 DUF3107 domain-containing protein [Nesterenkonia sp. HG001]NYJ78887.1 hypothetical protein [Nesterenkonia xinjiangensis]